MRNQYSRRVKVFHIAQVCGAMPSDWTITDVLQYLGTPTRAFEGSRMASYGWSVEYHHRLYSVRVAYEKKTGIIIGKAGNAERGLKWN